MSMRYACISAIEYYLPDNRLTNSDLALVYDGWSEKRFFNKTGILERRIAGQGETALDLAEKASRKLFDSCDLRPEQIDMIILCTQSPDYFLPTTACMLQHRLGLPTSCGAFDYNLGCSGFVYGLALARSMVESEIAENILLVTSDTYSKFIHPEDRNVRGLFGDGAAATLVTSSKNKKGIGSFVFGTDGAGAKHLIVPAGGMKMPKSPQTAELIKGEDGSRTPENLHMNSQEIMNFVMDKVPILVKDVLRSNCASDKEIKLYIFHQANKFILEYLRTRLEIPKEKFFINLEYTGNTVSASIPIALCQASSQGLVDKGDRVMLIGFGVGLSWAGTIINR